MTTYTTDIFGDKIEITADFSQASCPVHGDHAGRQVADFRHSATHAMRSQLEYYMMMSGEKRDEDGEWEDGDVAGQIENAIGEMTYREDVTFLDEDDLDAEIERIFGDDPSESELDSEPGLVTRIKAGPTNWTITVDDGAGGEDDYDFVGSLDDAIDYGEMKADNTAYDFGDDETGDLTVTVCATAAPSVCLSETTVRLTA